MFNLIRNELPNDSLEDDMNLMLFFCCRFIFITTKYLLIVSKYTNISPPHPPTFIPSFYKHFITFTETTKIPKIKSIKY